MKRTILLALLVAGLAAPAAQAETGPDYISSDNVTLTASIKTVGDGVGARVVGPYLYVTTTKSLSIFDIKTDPAHPKQIGQDTMDVEFENEEVPTNGRFLGISGQIGCPDPLASNIFNTSGNGTGAGSNGTGCLTTYDVSDPANIKKIKSISGAGQHTTTCALDCTWLYGSTGAITDNRDPAKAEVVGDWKKAFPTTYFQNTCHHLREIQPGILLGSCQPIVLMSIRPEDGGTPLKPVLIASGVNSDKRFIHSGRWPNQGTDKFVLLGGETNASPQCDDTVGAFMIWDASGVRDGKGGFTRGGQFKLLSEVRPTNGTYADGHSPYNGLGCSVHWFEEHPTFKDGGLVALAEYENGERFLQITPQGKIIEQGYFLPLGGSTSAPHWNPYDPQYVYSIDYGRGIDVLKYTGSTYVPDAQGNVPAQPGTTPGTNGAKSGSRAAPCASAAGFNSVAVRRSGSGLRFISNLRQKRPYKVQLFQQSSGRTILDNRLRGTFNSRKGPFTWKGKGSLTDGYYFARFSMPLSKQLTDVRRVTLRRSKGRFSVAEDFYQRTDCGLFKSYKLSSSVFGGRSSKPLGIAYQLARGAEGVVIEVRAGAKLVKRIAGGGRQNHTYRFSIPARLVTAGRQVSVKAQIQQGSPVAAQTLYAKRL